MDINKFASIISFPNFIVGFSIIITGVEFDVTFEKDFPTLGVVHFLTCVPGWSVFQNRAWNVSYPRCEKFKMFRTLNVASWKCFMPPFPGKSVKCFVPPTWAKKTPKCFIPPIKTEEWPKCFVPRIPHWPKVIGDWHTSTWTIMYQQLTLGWPLTFHSLTRLDS